MKLKRSDILLNIQAGDVILVDYVEATVVSAGIEFFSGGKATHALCALGGFDIVEADIGGVMRTNLDSYLRGKCNLTVKRLSLPLDHKEQAAVRLALLARVSDKYDFGMILHSAITLPIRRTLLKWIPPLGRLALRIIGRIGVNHTLSSCAELWLRGIRAARPKTLRNYDPDDVNPETLLRSAAALRTVVIWKAATLNERDR